MSCQVTRNLEKQGIEVRFPKPPSDDILVKIKSKGFRRSKFNKNWYVKYTESLHAFALELCGEHDAELNVENKSNPTQRVRLITLASVSKNNVVPSNILAKELKERKLEAAVTQKPRYDDGYDSIPQKDWDWHEPNLDNWRIKDILDGNANSGSWTYNLQDDGIIRNYNRGLAFRYKKDVEGWDYNTKAEREKIAADKEERLAKQFPYAHEDYFVPMGRTAQEGTFKIEDADIVSAENLKDGDKVEFAANGYRFVGEVVQWRKTTSTYREWDVKEATIRHHFDFKINVNGVILDSPHGVRKADPSVPDPLYGLFPPKDFSYYVKPVAFEAWTRLFTQLGYVLSSLKAERDARKQANKEAHRASANKYLKKLQTLMNKFIDYEQASEANAEHALQVTGETKTEQMYRHIIWRNLVIDEKNVKFSANMSLADTGKANQLHDEIAADLRRQAQEPTQADAPSISEPNRIEESLIPIAPVSVDSREDATPSVSEPKYNPDKLSLLKTTPKYKEIKQFKKWESRATHKQIRALNFDKKSPFYYVGMSYSSPDIADEVIVASDYVTFVRMIPLIDEEGLTYFVVHTESGDTLGSSDEVSAFNEIIEEYDFVGEVYGKDEKYAKIAANHKPKAKPIFADADFSIFSKELHQKWRMTNGEVVTLFDIIKSKRLNGKRTFSFGKSKTKKYAIQFDVGEIEVSLKLYQAFNFGAESKSDVPSVSEPENPPFKKGETLYLVKDLSKTYRKGEKCQFERMRGDELEVLFDMANGIMKDLKVLPASYVSRTMPTDAYNAYNAMRDVVVAALGKPLNQITEKEFMKVANNLYDYQKRGNLLVNKKTGDDITVFGSPHTKQDALDTTYQAMIRKNFAKTPAADLSAEHYVISRFIDSAFAEFSMLGALHIAPIEKSYLDAYERLNGGANLRENRIEESLEKTTPSVSDPNFDNENNFDGYNAYVRTRINGMEGKLYEFLFFDGKKTYFLKEDLSHINYKDGLVIDSTFTKITKADYQKFGKALNDKNWRNKVYGVYANIAINMLNNIQKNIDEAISRKNDYEEAMRSSEKSRIDTPSVFDPFSDYIFTRFGTRDTIQIDKDLLSTKSTRSAKRARTCRSPAMSRAKACSRPC